MRSRPENILGGVFIWGRLLGKSLLRDRAREGTKNQSAHHHGGTEHDHTHVLGGGNRQVSEDAAQQAKGRATRAECKIDALPQTTRENYQPGENGGHNQINGYEQEVARSPQPVQNARLWRNESVGRDPKKRDRMNERNQSALAIRKYPKVVHIR